MILAERELRYKREGRAREGEASRSPFRPDAPLTPRQSEVLYLLVAGFRTRELADVLGISPATARTHTCAVLSRLGAHTRLQAAVFAIRNGLVDPSLLPSGFVVLRGRWRL
jgi:DNA-binding NarL/FixJ family response regulator